MAKTKVIGRKPQAITLGEALCQGLTRRSLKDPPLSRLIADVLRLGGSPVTAASLVGVTPSTFKRWMKGKSKPSKKSTRSLSMVRRRGQLKPGRVKRLKSSNGLIISGKTLYDDRERDFDLKIHLRPGTVGRIIAQFLAGDVRGMENALLKGIHDSWYHNLFAGLLFSQREHEDTGDELVDAGIEVYGATYG